MRQIKINGIIELSDTTGQTVESVFISLRQNILAGSFESYSKQIIDRLNGDVRDSLDPLRMENKFTHIQGREYFFEFHIPARYFPLNDGGDIHLVDAIVGDMFSLSNTSIKRIHINDIQWEDLEHSLNSKITQPDFVRRQFKLDEFTPLLGFSVKPRLGLSDDDFLKCCVEVAEIGFNIIEPDTRKMLLSERDFDTHLNIANILASAQKPRKNIATYSINFSNYAGNLHRAIEQLSNTLTHQPITIKIDAGIDAISKIKIAKEVNPKIIITSYPLIKRALSSRIPDAFFDKFLSHCGVDIMYPGGFVALPGNKRHYNATEDTTLLSESISRYSNHPRNARFTPTLSGGISLGLLHLYYELYGPKVSLFLGGAVSTNTNGIKHGATLCMQVMDYAINQRKKMARLKLQPTFNLRRTNNANLSLLDAKIIKKIKDQTGSDYVIPREFIETNKLKSFTETNWQYWTTPWA